MGDSSAEGHSGGEEWTKSDSLWTVVREAKTQVEEFELELHLFPVFFLILQKNTILWTCY